MDIIPYDEKLIINDGGFINPDGKIIYTYGEEEKYALHYLRGKDYNYLASLKYPIVDTLADIWWESYKQFHHCEGNRKDIDLFLTSGLTKEQLDLYKLWLESKEFSLIPSEFMVRLLGFDKISAIVVPPTIMTTSLTPHVKYFNYYIMDWKIKLISPQEYNYKSAIF